MGQGQDALQAALSARAEGGQMPPQSQQTLGNQAVPAPLPAVDAQGMPVPESPGAAGAKPPSSEAELIIKALSQRLGSISKVEQGQVAPPESQQGVPGFAPEGAGMAMGGGGYRSY